jgi:hypothetical protein
MTELLPKGCSLVVPKGYTEQDFADFLKSLSEYTGPRVEGCMIVMRLINKKLEIERFGRKFEVWIWGVFGEVDITITEITDTPCPTKQLKKLP